MKRVVKSTGIVLLVIALVMLSRFVETVGEWIVSHVPLPRGMAMGIAGLAVYLGGLTAFVLVLWALMFPYRAYKSARKKK